MQTIERSTLPLKKQEFSYFKDDTGLPIDVRCISREGKKLQDAVLITKTPKKLARPQALSGCLKTVAVKAFSSVENENVGAVGAFAYIPSAHSTTAPDSIIVGNTGDSHAMMFRIASQGSNIEVDARLLTQNRHKSFNFFSARNENPRARNTDIDEPTIEAHILNRAELKHGERIFLGLFTDGALPLVDQIAEIKALMGTEERQRIQNERQKIEEYGQSILQEWCSENDLSLLNAEHRLSEKFIERARFHGEDDCATAMIVDVTTAPFECGVITGVIDGHRSPGSGKYARSVAFRTYEVFEGPASNL